jgi:hypothetical protein
MRREKRVAWSFDLRFTLMNLPNLRHAAQVLG